MTTSTRILRLQPLASIIAIPILGGLMILQTSLVSRFPLLRGTSDLVMLAIIAWALQKRVQTAWQWSVIGGLMFSLASALPAGVILVGYGLTTWVALVLRKRIWQVPLLAMFTTTFFGSLITHLVSYTALIISGSPLPPLEAFNLITLPSILLNLILAIPIYAIIGDLARWIYPEELSV